MLPLVAALAVGAPTTITSTAARTEIGVLPALNYSSDTGFGFGAIAAIARIDPDRRPFAWRLELLAYASIKEVAGELELPVQTHYVRIDHPAFLGRPRLRLNAELAFRKQSNARWFGVGSATPSDRRDRAGGRYNLYDRTFPSLSGSLRYAVVDRPVPIGKWRLEVFGGLSISASFTRPYAGSLLEAQFADERARGAGEVLGEADHALLVGVAGLVFDTRDDEFIPAHGVFAEASVRGSPGVQEDLSYAGAYLSLAGFRALGTPRLVLAGRLAADLLGGRVPFHQLGVMGGLNPVGAPGGGVAVRGVLAGRFAGKVKLVGNLELRAQELVRTGPFAWGAVAFLDAGRVWADLGSGPPLDADFPGLELGLGGGLRARWGRTFLIRVDFGYTPTEDTTGFYIDVGQVF